MTQDLEKRGVAALTAEREAFIREHAPRGDNDVRRLLAALDESRQVGGLTAAEWRVRCERAEARCAALGVDPSVPIERPSLLATMAAKLGAAEVRADAAEAARDEALAALAGLREAAKSWAKEPHDRPTLTPGEVELLDALWRPSSTLATAYTARVKVGALREAAEAMAREYDGTPEDVSPECWLRDRADEMEEKA